MVKNMCFVLRSHKFKSTGGRVCILPYILPVKSLGRGGLIYQFGVWLISISVIAE
jgi:hypothetical protein